MASPTVMCRRHTGVSIQASTSPRYGPWQTRETSGEQRWLISVISPFAHAASSTLDPDHHYRLLTQRLNPPWTSFCLPETPQRTEHSRRLREVEPTAAPALATAVAAASAPQPNLDKSLEGCRYDTWPGKEWAWKQGLDDDTVQAVADMIAACRQAEAMIDDLCDASTEIGATYRERVRQIEANYGGEVLKKDGLPILGLAGEDTTTDKPRKICGLANGALAMMLLVCDKRNIFADGGSRITAPIAFTILMGYW